MVSNYKFTDQEHDPETGLYNYDARLYDPIVGKFLSADYLIPNWYDPQLSNRYAYTRNNPLKYVDPDGHQPKGFSGVGGTVDPLVWISEFFSELGRTVSFETKDRANNAKETLTNSTVSAGVGGDATAAMVGTAVFSEGIFLNNEDYGNFLTFGSGEGDDSWGLGAASGIELGIMTGGGDAFFGTSKYKTLNFLEYTLTYIETKDGDVGLQFAGGLPGLSIGYYEYEATTIKIDPQVTKDFYNFTERNGVENE